MVTVAAKPTTRGKINIEAINKTVVLTPRVQRLREVHRAQITKVSAERPRLYMESWKETEGDHPAVRRAKAFRHILESKEIAIYDDELIVGTATKYPRGVYPNCEEYPARVAKVLKDAIETYGDSVKEAVGEEDVRTILEYCEFWKDKYPGARVAQKVTEIAGDLYAKMMKARLVTFPPQSPEFIRAGQDWEMILSKGLNGMIAEVRERMATLKQNPLTMETMEKLDWYEAVIISLQAMITLTGRYARLARELAAKEHNPTRRVELERIAEICDWVPANPPRSFYEALQFQWFMSLGLDWEKCKVGLALGRFDQYMWPYYERDIREGRMTYDEAGELLGCMFAKWMSLQFLASDIAGVYKHHSRTTFAPGHYAVNVTLGGVDRQGQDASNELSVFVVEALRQVRVHQPHLSLRFHRAMAPELIDKVIECNIVAGGNPAWFSDRYGTEFLLGNGLPIEEARDWQVSGCTHVSHKASGGTRDMPGTFNHAKIIELALNNGVDPVTGEQLGPATGDPRNFRTFDDMLEAYQKQFAHVLDLTVRLSNSTWSIAREDAAYFPLNSACVSGQIELGRDASRGGGKYPWLEATGLGDRGHPDAADSLTVIKKLVFEEKKITMDQLLTALAADFEGYEDIRQMCLAAPKYGNDDDEADDMMAWVWKNANDSIQQYRSADGQRFSIYRGGPWWATWAGEMVGALPAGRKAGTWLCDAAASPMQGRDSKGLTAVLNSVTKCCDPAAYVDGTTLNQRLSPSVLQSKAGRDKLAAAIASYFDRPAFQIQFNVFDKEMLLDAQQHPENYKDLLIRVAGYSAFWVDLTPQVQEEILGRMEQGLG